MSDEPQELGGNHAKDFNERLDAYAGELDAIEKHKAQAKLIKDAAKSEGYDMKAFAQVEKLKRKGAGQIASQLEFEMVRNTYLKAAGLPATLEEAQKLAAQEAEAEPAPKSEKQEKRRRARMN